MLAKNTQFLSSHWNKLHRALFYIGKSYLVLFTPNKTITTTTIKFLDFKNFEPIDPVKFLRITSHNNLTFKPHHLHALVKGA